MPWYWVDIQILLSILFLWVTFVSILNRTFCFLIISMILLHLQTLYHFDPSRQKIILQVLVINVGWLGLHIYSADCSLRSLIKPVRDKFSNQTIDSSLAHQISCISFPKSCNSLLYDKQYKRQKAMNRMLWLCQGNQDLYKYLQTKSHNTPVTTC